MPAYMYACPACEIAVEVLRAINRAADSAACPICRGLRAHAVPTCTIGRNRAIFDPPPVHERTPRI